MGASIGRACVFDQEVDANINQAIAIIRPDKFKILSSYLCYILNSDAFQSYFSKEKSGGARDNIDLYQLRNTPINIPPLPVQAELVELMDTAYNLKKTKESEAKKILESIDDYVMQELVVSQTKLVEKTTFSLSLSQIQQNFSPIFNTNKNYKKSSKYNSKALKYICKMYQPKTISKLDFVENGEFVVFGANGIIGKYDKFNHEFSEVLVTCRGATCGEVNVSEPKSWITGNAMVTIPLDKTELSKEYLAVVLKSLELNSVITGSAQPQITRENLQTFEIPLPPLDIQNKIVIEVTVRRARAKELQIEARQILETAKDEFEQKICD